MSAFKPPQLRGMLLEEAIAALLRGAGFSIVESAHGDPTLTKVASGIAVRGRGTDHQVDVIADFDFVPPFTYPPRLLLEAKYLDRRTGLTQVRNAAGVIRDVEQWFLPPSAGLARRFHYQSALFSATDFSLPAQRYAYAHDIFLVPLRRNALFRPIIDAIDQASRQPLPDLPLSEIRANVRRSLKDEPSTTRQTWSSAFETHRLIRAVHDVGFAFMARTSSGFPLFLVPSQSGRMESTVPNGRPLYVRVRFRRNEGWWIEDERDNPLFTFDLPTELLDVFDDDGRLLSSRAASMKDREFDEISAFRLVQGRVETMLLRLNPRWASELRHRSPS